MYPDGKVKYHGLKNQGATCYLNSVLQVLFMTEDYRDAVNRHSSKNPDTDFIDRHLTTLFDDLQERTASTCKITDALGIDRVFEQHDAAEYFEKILSLTSPDASQIFHGQLTHKTICSTCGAGTDSDGAFWHLPLALVDSCSESYSVVNGIKEYFKDADFSGENQMYCDWCDDKSDATIKCVVKHHPEVLMLLLKRFEFNYSHMTYVKNDCTVEVPYTLEIPENQTYELNAVVDHYGDLRSGHYTATIKSQNDDDDDDDGTWYIFDDSTVTLLDYKPFQVDHCKTSFSAYLLFYRKINVHARKQDFTERPDNFPSAAGDNEQFKVTVTMRGEEESEEAEQACEDNVHASQQTIPSNSQECNEERTDSSYNTQDARAEIIINDKEDMRGKEEADDEAKKNKNFSKENPLEESVEDQENDNGRQKTPDAHFDFKPTVSVSFAVQGNPNKLDEMREEWRRVKDVKIDKVGKTGDDEESEKREKSGTKYPDKDAENQDKAGLADIGPNTNGNLEGSQEAGQHYGLKPFSVNEQGDLKRMEKAEEEEETKASEMGKELKKQKLYTKYDLCYGRVGDDKHNTSKDDERRKDGNSSRNGRHEQQRREKRDDKEAKDQKRGDDKHEQRKVTLERRQDYGQNGDQSIRGLDDIPQNKSERKISSSNTRDEGVNVVRKTREQQNKKDEGIQNRADSSFRRAGSAGSRGRAENQEVGSTERTRREDFQPKGTDTFNEDIVGKRHDSKMSTTFDVMIGEDGIRQTPSGPQRSTEMKYTTIKTVKEGKSDLKKSPEEVGLSEPFSNLSLRESCLPEQQKCRTKGAVGHTKEETETNSTLQKRARKRQIQSDPPLGADAIKDAETKSGTHEKKRK